MRAQPTHLDPTGAGYRIRFCVDGERSDITAVDRRLGVLIADLRRLDALGARQAPDQPSRVSR